MRFPSGRFRVYFLAVLSMFFWGMSFIWTKEVFLYYQPLTTIFLRLGLSSVILFIFLASTNKLEKIKRADSKMFLLTAFFSFIILGEIISLQKMAGIGLVIGGVMISQVMNIKAEKQSGNDQL